MTIYQGSSLELAKFFTNLPFSTTGLGREKHLPGWQFVGPGTELTTRLRVPASTKSIALSEFPESWSQPVNYLDEQAKYYDIRYYNIAHDSSLTDDKKLDAKNRADEIMIEAIANYKPTSLKERFYRWVILNCIKFKVHFGLGFASQEEAAAIAKEMHSRIVHKVPRRKVISHRIDEIHAGDLMDLS